MRENSSRTHSPSSSPTRPSSPNTSGYIQFPPPIPITYSVLSASDKKADGVLDSLSSSFRQLVIDIATPPTSSIQTVASPLPTYKMNETYLSKTFSGKGHKPIHVKMYLKRVQLIAHQTTTDEAERNELYPMFFYDGLEGE